VNRITSNTARRARPWLAVLLLAGAAGVQAQIYKWVDPQGVTQYSDTPPPKSAARIELKSFSSGGSAVQLPFELAEAARNHPVTLYTTGQCNACDDGRAMLQARGIPYAEKTVASASDQAVLKQAGSDGQLPLLLVGRNRLVGYEAGAWNLALDHASYPAKRVLPSSYRYAPGTPAAPPKPPGAAALASAAAKTAAAEAAETAERARRSRPAPAPANGPPAFQF
jgi:glutaredoxin